MKNRKTDKGRVDDMAGATRGAGGQPSRTRPGSRRNARGGGIRSGPAATCRHPCPAPPAADLLGDIADRRAAKEKHDLWRVEPWT